MADPVTLAMVGAAAGAAMKPKDPLKGAMLGATVGFTGGTALGAAGVGASTAAAGTGIGASGAALPGVMGAGATTVPAAGIAGSSLGSGFYAAGLPNIATPALTTSAMAAPIAAPATFGATLANIPSALAENPMLAKTGLDATQGLMAKEPMIQAQPGQIRKGQPQEYVSLLGSQNSGVIRPQSISLL